MVLIWIDELCLLREQVSIIRHKKVIQANLPRIIYVS